MTGDDAAYVALTRLHRAYGDVCVRRAWEDIADLCLPDASFTFDLGGGLVVPLHGPGEWQAFGRRALGGFAFYRYVVLNAVVDVDAADAAHGRVDVLELGLDRASGEWLEIYGSYDDSYVRDGGRWLFASRAYEISARRTSPGNVAYLREAPDSP